MCVQYEVHTILIYTELVVNMCSILYIQSLDSHFIWVLLRPECILTQIHSSVLWVLLYSGPYYSRNVTQCVVCVHFEASHRIKRGMDWGEGLVFLSCF